MTEASSQQSLVVQLADWLASVSWTGLALLAVSAWCSYHYFFHPLAKYPGPVSARLGLPFWQFWHAYRREYAWSLEALHDRHGTAVRIGPNHISWTSCEAMNAIYSHGGNFDKSHFYRSFQVYAQHPSIFSDIDPASHADRRRSVSAAYSMKSLVGLEQCVDPLIESLVGELRARCRRSDGQAGVAQVNMAKWMHYFAMDAVGELAFGKSFGFVRRGSDMDGFLQGVSNLSHWGSMAGWLPMVSQPLRVLLRRLSGEAGPEMIDRMTRPPIDARYRALEEKAREGDEDEEVRTDLLAKFIKSKDPKTGTRLTPHQVLTTAISVVGAGSDTTSTALTAFLGYLVRHPAVYAAVQDEIDDAAEKGQLRNGSDPVSYATGVKLPWLQACIKETLRLHPPISMSLPRVVPRGGAMIGDIFVPAGTHVSLSPYVFHRSRQAYGDDARTFNPARWLNPTDEERRRLEKSNLAFGGGSRQCIGKNISLMELSKVLPTLLHAFAFAVPPATAALTQRDSDGRWVQGVPWTCDSTWFLDAKNLVLDVRVREEAGDGDD